jgi:hypothetical protein
MTTQRKMNISCPILYHPMIMSKKLFRLPQVLKIQAGARIAKDLGGLLMRLARVFHELSRLL